MDFERLSDAELNAIDFTFPSDPAINQTVLPGSPAGDVKFYVGCSKWGKPEWINMIYPPGTTERDYLHEYAKHFNSIELNATHYKLYPKELMEKWVENVKGQSFLFCPKLYKGITGGKLTGNHSLMPVILNDLTCFGSMLGPIFIRLSSRFTPERKPELYAFLRSLPKAFPFFIDIRNPAWFAEKHILDDLLGFLKQESIGLIITDSADRRDVVHMALTIPKLFIRFRADGSHPSDHKRIDLWAERIEEWVGKGLKELYFFVQTPNQSRSPLPAAYAIKKLNEVCDANLKTPQFIQNPL